MIIVTQLKHPCVGVSGQGNSTEIPAHAAGAFAVVDDANVLYAWRGESFQTPFLCFCQSANIDPDWLNELICSEAPHHETDEENIFAIPVHETVPGLLRQLYPDVYDALDEKAEKALPRAGELATGTA
jgi:hypothetical protein